MPLSGTATPGAAIEARAVGPDGEPATGWSAVAVADPSGAWSGAIAVPLQEDWLRAEVRLEASPETRAVTPADTRFGVGHVIAIWGQSEVFHMLKPGSVAPEPLIGYWDQVEDLARVPSARGARIRPSEMTALDALPADHPLAGLKPGDPQRVLAPGVYEWSDLDLAGASVLVPAGAHVTLTDCVIGEAPGRMVASAYAWTVEPGGTLRLRHCDLRGAGDGTGVRRIVGAIADRDTGRAGRLEIDRAFVYGFPSDSMNIANGWVRDSLIDAPTTGVGVPRPYDAATTYAVGDRVVESDVFTSHAFVARKAGRLPAPDFSGGAGKGASSADWEYTNPHADQINVREGVQDVAIEGNFFNGTAIPIADVEGNGYTGINNSVRRDNVGGAPGGQHLRIVGNIMARDETRNSFAIHNDQRKAQSSLELRHNRIDGRPVYPDARVVCEAITRGDGSPQRIPAECTQGEPTPEPTTGSEVQVMWHDRDPVGSGAKGVRHRFVTATDPVTPALGALANAAMAARPGEKFAFVFQAQSGTGFDDLLKDGSTKRSWADDRALHDHATADGQEVGIVGMSWYASPSGLERFYDDEVFPLITGRTIEGAPVTFPGPFTRDSGRGAVERRFDHWFGELYDYAHTRWAIYGPHRFDATEDRSDAVTLADGSRYFRGEQTEAMRRAVREMVANPHGLTAAGEPIFLPITVEPLNYIDGEDRDGDGAWEDITHPADDTLDGLGQIGRLIAHAMIRSAGLARWPVPEWDVVEWARDGAWVRFGSTAGPVTTTRRARGMPPLADPPEGWTEVLGFQIDGAPARRAEIGPDGMVYVYPDGGGRFSPGATVQQGEGTATGTLLRDASLEDALWLDVPIVDVGAARVEGIAVRPLAPDAVRANTVGSGRDHAYGDGLWAGTGGASPHGGGSDSVAGAGGGSGSGSGSGGVEADGPSGADGAAGGPPPGGEGGEPAAFASKADGSPAHLRDPEPLGGGVAGVTVEARLRLSDWGFGDHSLLGLSDGALSVAAASRAKQRRLAITMRDAGGARVFEERHPRDAFELDRWFTLRVSARHGGGGKTGSVRVFVDGVEAPLAASSEFAASGAPTFDPGAAFELLDGGKALSIARLRVWKEARADGGLPAGAPYKEIAGGAAAFNGDPWRAGAAAFQ